VLKAANQVTTADKSVKIVFIDMFNIRTEEEFYKELLEKTIHAISGKFDEVLENIRKFLKQWVPTISFSPDSQQEFSLSLNWSELKQQPDEILNLAENYSSQKGNRLIICIDEFQNIAYFEDPLAFQKKLRSHWQKHQSVSYCLYGSKRHMLMEVFTSSGMPFYKFGDIIFLSKISGEYWTPFIVERFKTTGKIISAEKAGLIPSLVENHPYYVQQLAQLVWLRTLGTTKEEDIEQAYENLILQMSMLFQSQIENLTTTQVNFLKAVLDGEQHLSSQEALTNFKLGTSANVARLRKSLINKELIDEYQGELILLDPVFAAWLKKYYFI
jgi:hypothetical protein